MKALFLAITLFTFGMQSQAQVVADTTEIAFGNKVITVVTDTETKKRDINITTTEKAEEVVESKQPWPESDHDGDSDSDEDEEKKSRKKVDVDFLSLDIGMNFLTSNNSFNLPTNYSLLETKPLGSTHLGFHFLKTKISLIKGYVNLVTALTLDNNRYSFQNSVVLVPNQENLSFYEDSVSYKKNKLITTYAQIPLLLNFQTNPDKQSRNFHLSLGGYAGLLLGAHTKQKSSENGKVKFQDDYNLNQIRYGATARIGFGGLELYANYNLSSMFREDQGPDITPVTFGISLTGPM